MMMKNPRKRRKAGPGPATASDPDIDPPTHHDLITCQIPVDTADGECHSGIRSAAAQYTECGGRSRHLYVYSQTLDCLLQKQCIPCLYKIFPDGRNDRYLLELLSSTTGIASKKGNGTSSVPAAVIKVAGAGTGTAVRQPTRRGEEYPSNTRPELCGRSGLMPVYVSKEATGRGSGSGALSSLQLADLMTNVYGSCIAAADSQSEHTVLTVGDGDFTFSLSLAETDRFQQYIDCSSDKSSSSSTLSGIIGCHQRGRTGCSRLKLTATSHESYQSICSTYPQAEDTLHRLKYLGATVLHDVDATDLHLLHHGSSTDLLQHGSPIAAEGSRTFDFIIWNFPCVSLPAGADGQTSELEQNRTLLRRFFSNIRPFLTADRGEVHITHKTIEPFSYYDLQRIARQSGFLFAYGMVFDRCVFPGYTNRKALDRKSFPCHDAQTFVFIPLDSACCPSSSSDCSSYWRQRLDRLVAIGVLRYTRDEEVMQQLLLHPYVKNLL